LDFEEIARAAGHKMKIVDFHLNKDSGWIPVAYGVNLKWDMEWHSAEKIADRVRCFRR
jgi:hypothetical protein